MHPKSLVIGQEIWETSRFNRVRNFLLILQILKLQLFAEHCHNFDNAVFEIQ